MLAPCYNPLGLVALILLGAKSIYWEVRELGTRWNQQIPEVMLKWSRWTNNLREKIVVPRGFRLQHERLKQLTSTFLAMQV